MNTREKLMSTAAARAELPASPALPTRTTGLPAYVPMPQATSVFGVSRSAVYRAASQGHVVLKKMGKSSLIETASMMAYLSGLPNATLVNHDA